MCGFVAAIGKNNVGEALITALKFLEHTEFDIESMVLLNGSKKVNAEEWQINNGKLDELESLGLTGKVGIAEAIWNIPERPHKSLYLNSELALVLNGIISNYEIVKTRLTEEGVVFNSDDDSELVTQLVCSNFKKDKNILSALRKSIEELEGTYSIICLQKENPECLYATHKGSLVAIGQSAHGSFISSDPVALLTISDHFIYLEEGDIAEIKQETIVTYDANHKKIQRKAEKNDANFKKAKRGIYPNLLLKEVFTQPEAILQTLRGRLTHDRIIIDAFGNNAVEIFKNVHRVQIVSSPRSFHAGLIAKGWLEEISGIPCQMELANDYRVRDKVMETNKLFVTLSQSGEEEDTLEALHIAKNWGYVSYLAICNTPQSSIVRESDLALMTGGVTEANETYPKGFITQLVGLLLLTLGLGHYHRLNKTNEQLFVKLLRTLPKKLQEVLALDAEFKNLSHSLADKQEFTILGGGMQFPIAKEAVVKIKDYASMYAEAYPAGDFQHYFPSGLINSTKAIIALAPGEELDILLTKLQSMSERGHEVIILTDKVIDPKNNPNIKVLNMPTVDRLFRPFLYMIPLQLIAYYVGNLKGVIDIFI